MTQPPRLCRARAQLAAGPTGFEVPLLDATYWLDTAMPTRSYGGGAVWTGIKRCRPQPPRLRGMCRNITPI
ncbi:hypothetical protein [Sorlinia euscelidii]|uniref:hypothetical protein n=1 Tax=Sorlinia euscelidii TaxID=3081148 RepID=UPI003AACF1D7